MRKFIIVLLIIVLLLCACGGNKPTTNDNVVWCAGDTTGWCSDKDDDVSWFQELLNWPDGE